MTRRNLFYSNDSHSHYLHIFFDYNDFMSKLENINKRPGGVDGVVPTLLGDGNINIPAHVSNNNLQFCINQ